jgi:hypothetical protein
MHPEWSRLVSGHLKRLEIYITYYADIYESSISVREEDVGAYIGE